MLARRRHSAESQPVLAGQVPASLWQLGHRPALDGVRGIAVLLVMGYHFFIPGFGGGGYVGVTMFFVLSGFLITALLLKERRASGGINVVTFYGRRARRLVPALLALVAVVLLLGVGRLGEVGPNAAAATLYYANWAQQSEPISLEHLSHTWSLAVEEQFYLVWPWILIATYRRRWSAYVAAAIAVVAIALRTAGVHLAGLERLDALMIGCLLALAATAGHLGSIPVRLGWLGAAALALLAALPHGPGWELTIAAVATAVLIAALEQPGKLNRLFAWRPLVVTGQISYGLYLWHFAVGWQIWPHIADWHWLGAAALLTAISFACAAASWRYVERPAMRLAPLAVAWLAKRHAGAVRGQPLPAPADA